MADTPAVLSQQVTIGVKIQATDEGTLETIAAADCARSLAGDIGMPTMTVERFDRPLTGDDMDREPGRPTRKMLAVSWGEDVMGRRAGAPYFDAALRACGCQAAALHRIRVDTAASVEDLRPGEVISNAGGDEAVLIEAIQDGEGDWWLVYTMLAGSDPFVAEELLTGAESAATATTSVGASPEAAGWLYRPLSESTGTVPPAATVAQFRGGEVWRGPMRGDFTLAFNEGAPGVLNFEFQGPQDLAGDALPEQGVPADVPVVENVAPLATLARFVIDPAGEAYQPPVMSQFEMRMGNNVSMRPTITEGSFQTSGYRAPRMRRRGSTLQFNPEKVSDTTFGVVRRAITGEPFRLDVRYGGAETDGGRVALHVYSGQMQAPELSDSEGVMLTTITSDVRKGPRVDWPWHLAVYHLPEPA